MKTSSVLVTEQWERPNAEASLRINTHRQAHSDAYIHSLHSLNTKHIQKSDTTEHELYCPHINTYISTHTHRQTYRYSQTGADFLHAKE